jgi:HlyD family secretion protein
VFIELPVLGPVLGKVKKNRRLPIAIALGSVFAVIAIGAGVWIARARGGIDLETYTVEVQSEELTLRITANGKVVPVQTVNLSPKNAGTLVQLMVEQGDRVRSGQVIARMDASGLEGQFIQAQAAVAQAKARLEELQAGNRPQEVLQAEARMARAEADYELKVSSAPQLISEAESQLKNAQSELALAKARLERYRNLVKAGAVSMDQFQEEQRNYDSALASYEEANDRLIRVQIEANQNSSLAAAGLGEAVQGYDLSRAGTRPEVIAQAQADVESAIGQLRNIQTQVEDTVIRAPFDGVIAQKYATEGAFVTPTTSASNDNSATSTSIVALARDLEIIAEVPEVDIGQIRPGQEVELRADAYPEQVFKGQVRLVAPEAVVERNVTSFQVRVAIVSGQEELRSGMNIDLTFLGKTLKQALVVPTVAIATQKGKTGVYLPDDQRKPEFNPVTIGSSSQDKTQVLEGLEPGDRVFIDFPEGIDPAKEEEASN